MFKIVFEGLLSQLSRLQLYWNAGLVLDAFLFVNDHVPADGDVYGDYTQPTFTGYALGTAQGFSIPTIVGTRAITAGNPLQWLCTVASPVDVCYGWGLYDHNLAQLLGAERFDAPIPIQNPGDSIVRYPVMTLKAEV